MEHNKMNFLKRVRQIGNSVLDQIKSNLLLVTTILGVLLGFAVGFIVREYSPSANTLLWLGLPGQLYLRLFKMLIVPLIMCTVICGVSSLDPKSNGKISLIAFLLIVSSNAVGSALGIGFSLLFKPGMDVARTNEDVSTGDLHTTDIFIDFILNIFPENLIEAMFVQTQTKYRTIQNSFLLNGTRTINNVTEQYFGKVESPNVTGLIFVCTLFGIAGAKLGEKGRPFLHLVQSMSDIVTTVLRWFVWTTPIGVISLIAVSIAPISDVTIVFTQMGMFVATVTASVATYQLVLMPLALFLLTKRNPFYFLATIAEPWVIAFATTTTAIAIPEMLHACEVKNKIDKRVSGFVIPFSVSLSCNGGAMYIASATIFVANISGTILSVHDIVLLWVLASLAAMAIPSVPSASLVTALMVMTSLNIQIDDIALLLALEWIVDRMRITCSVVSHTFCAAIVYQFCRKDLTYNNYVEDNNNNQAVTSNPQSSPNLSHVPAHAEVS